MSQLIRNSVLSPKVAIREQKTYWSRLYGSAKSLAVIKVAYQIDSPVVLITNNVLSAANLVSELENFSEDFWLTYTTFFDLPIFVILFLLVLRWSRKT